jgi:hypothetical protein
MLAAIRHALHSAAQRRGDLVICAVCTWRSVDPPSRVRHDWCLDLPDMIYARLITSLTDPLRLITWLFTAFLLVLIPVYLSRYGPTNFLYFCDLSLLLTALSLWLRWRLPASMAAVAILVPQALWVADLLTHLAGFHFLGMTDYMFNSGSPLFLRLLSLFHVWLPVLLLWLVPRLGYDPRAFRIWTGLGTGLLLISYFLLPAPPAPVETPWLPVNVNLVYGFSDTAPQQMLPPLVYLGLMIVAMPLLCHLPAHLLLSRFAVRNQRAG